MPVSPSTAIPVEAMPAAQPLLTFFFGAIARVLVRDAAAKAVSAQDFLERLRANVQSLIYARAPPLGGGASPAVSFC
jgi:hypothetical protein